ncbi:universal stress protein [Pseudonocardia abyssalis]|uniref:Universal stress protein n=1 Tax=Pseudonocardia abyssalis TaxID=2792008 RepID=A0ABS6UNF9_9PSEU|nr:universal stress protein [Pseudonocardia abyssalis]MBW0119458.1 universal stress protein [Pseudonocardia abyssalis]MBW0133791.1 universal stress protein [Pseudonocardia abyssalis]
MDGEGTGTVVVGVDGSPGSRAAVEHALEDAARRGARLRAVVAAQLPEYWATAYGMVAPPPISEVLASARDAGQEMVDEVLAARPDLAARVEVSVEARAGAAGRVLLDAADGADVLVIGHRGRGAMSSAMLGSVGLHCVLHASCPVTIVRSTRVAEAVARPEAAAVPV